MAVQVTVKTLKQAWHLMSGVVCVYKPAELSCTRVRKGIIANICRDMQQFEPKEPRTFVSVLKSPDSDESYSVQCAPNLTDIDLVRGPAIEPNDVKLGIINHLGNRVSGVMMVAINDGNRDMKKMVISRPLSVYQIKAEFGLATDTHWHDGKVWEKSTFFHLSKSKMDRVLSSIEASNQRKMFEYCGVDPSSQTAYELASRGLLRPAYKGPPVIYGIKCIHFDPPHYTLELHCINENSTYLSTLIHDLGIALKTNSVCHQIRCIRYGHFTVEHALLRKHWTFEHFVSNMNQCKEMLESLPSVTPILSPPSTQPPETNQTQFKLS